MSGDTVNGEGGYEMVSTLLRTRDGGSRVGKLSKVFSILKHLIN